MAWISCCWVFCWARSTCRCRCSCTLPAHQKVPSIFDDFWPNSLILKIHGCASSRSEHDHHDSRTAHPLCTDRFTASKASNSAELCSASLRASCSTRKAWAWGKQEERKDFDKNGSNGCHITGWISMNLSCPHETHGLRSFDRINACQHRSPAETERDPLGDILLLSYPLLHVDRWLLGILQMITAAIPPFYCTRQDSLGETARNSLIICLLATAF